MQKVAGILLSIGAVAVIIGDAQPIVSNVFGAIGNPRLQAEYIKNDPTGWAVANLLMGAGALIAAIGLVPFARQVQSISNNRNVRIASYGGAVMAIVGALLWATICYNRVVRSPEEVVSNMDIPTGMAPIYFLLTEGALLIIGFVLLQTGYPKWLGWLVLVLGGLMLVAVLASGGLPPAVYYILFLILGIALTLVRTRSPQPSVELAQRQESHT